MSVKLNPDVLEEALNRLSELAVKNDQSREAERLKFKDALRADILKRLGAGELVIEYCTKVNPFGALRNVIRASGIDCWKDLPEQYTIRIHADKNIIEAGIERVRQVYPKTEAMLLLERFKARVKEGGSWSAILTREQYGQYMQAFAFTLIIPKENGGQCEVSLPRDILPTSEARIKFCKWLGSVTDIERLGVMEGASDFYLPATDHQKLLAFKNSKADELRPYEPKDKDEPLRKSKKNRRGYQNNKLPGIAGLYIKAA